MNPNEDNDKDEETEEKPTKVEETIKDRFPPDENFPPDSEQIYAWSYFPDVPF